MEPRNVRSAHGCICGENSPRTANTNNDHRQPIRLQRYGRGHISVNDSKLPCKTEFAAETVSSVRLTRIRTPRVSGGQAAVRRLRSACLAKPDL